MATVFVCVCVDWGGGGGLGACECDCECVSVTVSVSVLCADKLIKSVGYIAVDCGRDALSFSMAA